MLYGFASSHTRDGAVVRLDPRTKERAVIAQIDFGAFDHTSGGVFSSKMVLTPNGRLFGTYTTWTNGFSAIFSFDPATHALEVVKAFPVDPNTWIPGPDGGLVKRLFLGSDGWLYGGTAVGSDPDAQFSGSFFKLDPSNGTFVTIARPVMPDAFTPTDSMVEAAPGIWYAGYLTFSSNFCGGIGRLDASTGEFTVVRTYNADTDPCEPGGLTRAQDGTIYGVFATGGPEAVPGDPNSRGAGGIFSLDAATGVVATLHMFRNDGDVRFPHPDVIAAPDGMLYAGYMIFGPRFDNNLKGIVRVDPVTGTATKLAELPDPEGFLGPGVILGGDGRFYLGHQSPGKAFTIAVLDAISVAPASGPFGGTAAISATLKAIGVPLSGRTIAFTLNGAAIGSAMTNADGVATLNNVSIAGIAIGTHANAIGASFAGDEFFPATSGTGSVTVVDVPTPGVVLGAGFIRDAEGKHEFAFAVHESAAGVNRGVFTLRSKRKQASDDRFATDDITSVWFGEDVVMFSGPGAWNGQTGYRFEAVAAARTRLAVTIYDAAGTIVASLDDEIDGGTIVRLKR